MIDGLDIFIVLGRQIMDGEDNVNSLTEEGRDKGFVTH